MIARRGRREPLQHILGWSPFFGCDLITPSGLLAPRPETEELAEWVAMVCPSARSLLDLGCGSGAIGCALGRHMGVPVAFADCDPLALETAMRNAARNRVDCSGIFRTDWFSGLPGKFPLIVSNPPYLTPDEFREAAPEVREGEPSHALLGGGEDGLDAIRLIIAGAPAALEAGGQLFLEHGIGQAAAIRAEAERLGYGEIEQRVDLSGRDRFTRVAVPPQPQLPK